MAFPLLILLAEVKQTLRKWILWVYNGRRGAFVALIPRLGFAACYCSNCWGALRGIAFYFVPVRTVVFLQVLNTSLNFWTWWRIRVYIVKPWSCIRPAPRSTRCVSRWPCSVQVFNSLRYVHIYLQHLERGQKWDNSCLPPSSAGCFSIVWELSPT